MSDDAWWANHYKTALKWYVIRVKQYLDGENPEIIEGILRATLPDFATEVGVNLDEVRLA
jgi:hypothetical protein